jgi:hypothetical protein
MHLFRGLGKKPQKQAAWPGIARLAQSLGVRRRRVQQLLRQLEASGELVIERGGGCRYNMYHIPPYAAREAVPEHYRMISTGEPHFTAEAKPISPLPRNPVHPKRVGEREKKEEASSLSHEHPAAPVRERLTSIETTPVRPQIGADAPSVLPLWKLQRLGGPAHQALVELGMCQRSEKRSGKADRGGDADVQTTPTPPATSLPLPRSVRRASTVRAAICSTCPARGHRTVDPDASAQGLTCARRLTSAIPQSTLIHTLVVALGRSTVQHTDQSQLNNVYYPQKIMRLWHGGRQGHAEGARR